jgi:hypothetical protein
MRLVGADQITYRCRHRSVKPDLNQAAVSGEHFFHLLPIEGVVLPLLLRSFANAPSRGAEVVVARGNIDSKPETKLAAGFRNISQHISMAILPGNSFDAVVRCVRLPPAKAETMFRDEDDVLCTEVDRGPGPLICIDPRGIHLGNWRRNIVWPSIAPSFGTKVNKHPDLQILPLNLVGRWSRQGPHSRAMACVVKVASKRKRGQQVRSHRTHTRASGKDEQCASIHLLTYDFSGKKITRQRPGGGRREFSC